MILFLYLVYHVLKYAQTKVYQNRMIGTCLNLRLKFEKKIAKYAREVYHI